MADLELSDGHDGNDDLVTSVTRAVDHVLLEQLVVHFEAEGWAERVLVLRHQEDAIVHRNDLVLGLDHPSQVRHHYGRHCVLGHPVHLARLLEHAGHQNA